MQEDWIKHICHTHAEKSGVAWCGAKLEPMEWYFVNIDHAAYSQLHHDRIVPCKLCVDAVIKAIRTQLDAA